MIEDGYATCLSSSQLPIYSVVSFEILNVHKTFSIIVYRIFFEFKT